MRIAKKVYPNLPSYSQDYLLEFLEMPSRKHKRALSDIDNIYSIYKHLKDKVLNENIDLRYHQLNPYKVNIPESDKIDNPMIKNKHFAFTGTLEKMERKDACELVVRNSGICDSSIIKKTNYLVLGELDYAKTKHGEKSSKIIKAEKLISDGCDLKIIDENYFYEMIRSVTDE
jgi:DNA polymerase-3 subunit epsilon